MAISSTTSTTAASTSTSVNSTVKSAGQSVITSMGVGSGVDVQALAQSLVNASKQPQADSINKKISKSEARISGYAAIKYMVSNLKDKFAALDKTGDYNTQTVSSSQSANVSATVSGNPTPGTHTVSVSQLALGKRVISHTGFQKPTDVIGSQTVTLNLTGQNDPAQELSAVTVGANATLTDLVYAMNTAWSAKGVTVQLVNKGGAATDPAAPYHLVVTGPTGSANNFSLAGIGNVSMDTLQAPQDAQLNVDGVDIQSSSNTVNEAVTGLTLNLSALTSGSAVIDVKRDLSSIKTKVNELVTAYNDLNTVLNDATDVKSQTADYGATLVGDSTVDALRRQVRELFLPSTLQASTGIQSLRDLGISLDHAGQKMTVDDTRLTQALSTRFDETVSMLTNNQSKTTDTLASSSTKLPGEARNAVMKLADMLRSYSTLNTQSNNAQDQITKYKADLEKLDTRMNLLLERYNKQFSAMESLVSQTNSLKTSLKSSFDGMMASYTNN